MTLRELSQFYWLKKEIAADTERLRGYEARMLGAVNMDGMPHGTEAGRGTEGLATAIAGIRAELEAKQARCLEELRRLEAYIADIDDSLTRQIYTLRFVDCLTWEQVAAKLGGGNTAQGVRSRVYRYIWSHP